jgi:tetratricopeptide (TPR) repeat protein
MSRAQRALVSALAVAVGAATVTITPPIAHAQKGDKNDKKVDKKKLASQYVDAGLAAQDAGDYDSAVEFYQKAYAVVPHPVLIYNIAQAHRLGGHLEAALADYQQYLAADPNGPKVKEATAFVTQLQPLVEAEKAKAAEEAAAAEQARLAEEARLAAEAAAKKKAEEDASAKLPPPEPEPEPEPHHASGGLGTKRIAAIGLGGAGVLGVVGGVVFGLKAKSISDGLSQTGAVYDPAEISRGEAANRNMFICYGVGGALLVAGAVLFVIGAPQAESADGVTLAPVIGADLTGFAVSGGF